MQEEIADNRPWWLAIADDVFNEYWHKQLFANTSLKANANVILRETNPNILAVEGTGDHGPDAWIERMVIRRFNNSRQTNLGKAFEELVRLYASHTFGKAWHSPAPSIDVEFDDDQGCRQLLSVKSSYEWSSKSSRVSHRSDFSAIQNRLAPTTKSRIVLALCNGSAKEWDTPTHHVMRGDALWAWVTGGEPQVSQGLLQSLIAVSGNYHRSQQRVLRQAINQIKREITNPEVAEKYPWIRSFTSDDPAPISPSPSVSLEVGQAA